MSEIKAKKPSGMKSPDVARVEMEPAEKRLIEKELAEKRPQNRARGDDFPVDGFALAVDGKFKSRYTTSEDAVKAGLELKHKFPILQIAIYDAVNKVRTAVELPAA